MRMVVNLLISVGRGILDGLYADSNPDPAHVGTLLERHKHTQIHIADELSGTMVSCIAGCSF